MENRKDLDFSLKGWRGEYKLTKNDLLVDNEPILVLLPKLIELLSAVGYQRKFSSMIPEALILQHIHLETERNGICCGTYKWVEGNVFDWIKKRFSSIKYVSFEKALEKLIEDKFIKQIQIGDREFFRINYRRFFYSQKIIKAQEQKKKHIKKLKEYKARKKAGTLTKQLRGKLIKLEKKLKKKKTKAVFFKLS